MQSTNHSFKFSHLFYIFLSISFSWYYCGDKLSKSCSRNSNKIVLCVNGSFRTGLGMPAIYTGLSARVLLTLFVIQIPVHVSEKQKIVAQIFLLLSVRPRWSFRLLDLAWPSQSHCGLWRNQPISEKVSLCASPCFSF